MDTPTTQTWLVRIGQHAVSDGRRTSGFTVRVEADDRDDAAAIGLARARQNENARVAQHNRDAVRFGTWTTSSGLFDFQVEGVRKAPAGKTA